MIQETYKISFVPDEDGIGIHQRVDAIMEKVKKSNAYRQAKNVYIKLLMMQIPQKDAKAIDQQVRRGFPGAAVAGMALTVIQQEAHESYLLMSVCYFQNAHVTVLWHNGAPEEYREAGREFGHRIAENGDVKAVEMFCIVMNIDLAPFVLGISEENPEIPFYGSLAGMYQTPSSLGTIENLFDREKVNSLFLEEMDTECYILGDGLHTSGIVMVSFSGEDLHVQADYLLGWKPLGKEMVLTETASPTCAATVDDIPAVKIFQKYLNVPADAHFLMNVCDFPMIIERDGCLIARTPPYFDRAGRLYFSGDVHEGEKIRLSYANPEELLRETRGESRRMLDFHPEGLFLVVCPNRTIFLGEDAYLEIEPYRKVCSQVMVSYGPGEIYRYHGKGGVLNSSLLAIGMREGECPENGIGGLADRNRSRGGTSCKVIPLSTRLAAFLDATTRELRESNRELKDMAEIARAASVAKSHFLSNMSHEIRTPINAILGMDEMILREAEDNTILGYAENIRMAGSNLLSLINDILDFSKIESGKLDIIPVEYSLGSVLNDLVNMIEHRAEKKGLSFAVNSSPDLPSILYGDEIRIKQVVTNILTNAVKYTQRGFVALSVEFQKKDEKTILLKVSVQDSGIGIKEEDIKKLFCAFERIEEKRNRTIEGTGLGMNITKQLLSLMNSKLEVKSIYGKGSTFSFVLEQGVVDWKPMGDFDEAYQRSFAQRKKYCEEFTAPDARILVVDDTVMNLTVVKGLLKQTKVQIDTAESGTACLEAVKRKKYDIIFLDHRMPGMDGIETLQAMKELKGNKNEDTPVICLTANAVSGARNQYISAGFKDYLTKPIDGHELEATILKYLPEEKLGSRTEAKAKEEVAEQQEDVQEDGVLPGWLTRLPDIDTSSGILYCGTEEAYLEVLTVFAEAIVPAAEEIKRYYEAENWKDFTTKVHALKSTARLIGAKELSENAKSLEEAGNREDIDTIRKGAEPLLQSYLSYAEKLSPLCEKKELPVEEKAMIGEADLVEAYETLGDVVAAFDYDSMMFILRSLEEYRLPEADAKRWTALREAARKPDWGRIRDLLEVR